MSVPGPLPSSASASLDVGAAARSDGVVLGLADTSSDGLADGLAEADAVALAAGGALGRVDAEPPTLPGVDPVLEVAPPDVGVALGVVGLGADVVFVGFGVGFLVGTGVLVFVGAGGATRGCCPDPKRKPTTVPGAGS